MTGLDGQLAYLKRLVEMGHFNYPCSTEVDTEMVERALAALAPEPEA